MFLNSKTFGKFIFLQIFKTFWEIDFSKVVSTFERFIIFLKHF